MGQDASPLFASCFVLRASRCARRALLPQGPSRVLFQDRRGGRVREVSGDPREGGMRDEEGGVGAEEELALAHRGW
jgi:hypothetical protein